MQEMTRTIRLMGTNISTKIWHADPEPIIDQVENLLYLYKDRFSANDLTSELMEVNLNAGIQAVPVAEDLYELIAIGKEHSCAEGSHLNITIGPLVQTWRIGFKEANLPDNETIQEKLSLIDPTDIVLDEVEQSVYLKKEGMAIDLGALAKGFIADKIMEHLRRMGVDKALINLGGNVLTMGVADHNPDGKWRIGIQHPKKSRGNNAAVVTVGEESVVTSGIYERTFEYQGKTYHHIFDSQTGYPVDTDLASLTIVSEQSVDGEIWTTRLFGADLLTIYQTVCQTEGIEAIIITKDDKLIYTPGLEGRIS
ncbi:FAD:protein FMN transferase [Streptococcus cameli]